MRQIKRKKRENGIQGRILKMEKGLSGGEDEEGSGNGGRRVGGKWGGEKHP